MRKIGLIGVPSSAGARRTGQERAPQALRRSGLLERLREAGLSLIDLGDLPAVSFRPDPGHPKAQNLPMVAEVAQQLAARVAAAARDDLVPLVLGGDCTITLGVIAGLAGDAPDLGLMYFDGDVDLNTPDTTPSGVLDGMVMAHMIGWGAPALARLGPRYPLMPQERVVLFGYNTHAGTIDPAEQDALQRCRMMRYPAAGVRGRVRESARDALGRLESGAGAIVVHFDVDVMDAADFAAADVPHRHGLGFEETMSALEVFWASPRVAALVITEFNADRDVDGAFARRLVDALAKALGDATAPGGP